MQNGVHHKNKMSWGEPIKPSSCHMSVCMGRSALMCLGMNSNKIWQKKGGASLL